MKKETPEARAMTSTLYSSRLSVNPLLWIILEEIEGLTDRRVTCHLIPFTFVSLVLVHNLHLVISMLPFHSFAFPHPSISLHHISLPLSPPSPRSGPSVQTRTEKGQVDERGMG